MFWNEIDKFCDLFSSRNHQQTLLRCSWDYIRWHLCVVAVDCFDSLDETRRRHDCVNNPQNQCSSQIPRIESQPIREQKPSFTKTPSKPHLFGWATCLWTDMDSSNQLFGIAACANSFVRVVTWSIDLAKNSCHGRQISPSPCPK